MKKIIGNPLKKNKQLIEIIKNTKINNFYIRNLGDFRDRILNDINSNDDVLVMVNAWGKNLIKLNQNN